MNNQKNTIRQIVGYLNNNEENGGYWLPNIQRPFVWKEEQMERLYDSILREYPIGTLLIWKTKSKIRRRKFIDNYHSKLKLTDFYVSEDDKQKMLVLDGQQRLQSLFIGLIGSYENKELCIDILSGELFAPDDIKYRLKFLTKEDVKGNWFKLKDIVFSNLEYNQIVDDLIKKAGISLNEDEKNKANTIVSKIVRIFRAEENILYQVVDSIDNSELYKEDDIVEIFIRANSGGTLLGKSDLLFSLLTSSWEDSDENMEELLESLNRTGYRFTRDFILKTCLSVLGKGASYKVEKFRDNSEGSLRKQIINNWNEIANSIKEVKDYIYDNTFVRTDEVLPSYLTLIPLIYFRYHFHDKWKKICNAEEYLLRTLLSSAFSGSPDNLIDRCTKKINESKEFNIEEIFGVIRAEGRNLEVSKEDILNVAYGSKEIHLVFNLWYKFNYQPSFDNNKPQVDHIFPQSILKNIKIQNPNTGRNDILKYKTFERDQLANCMLLTREENGASGKSDIPPIDWFANKDEEYLKRHLIPLNKNLWHIDKYEEFIEERKKLIINKLINYIIK